MTENVSAASTAAESKRKTWGGKGLNVAIIVAAVLTVAGIACWVMQLSGGMVQTGMRNLDSWGLYITNFMFFVGLSAGGLIISSVPNAFGMKGFGGISKVAIWTSVCCTCAAIGFVVVDLGGPARLWELFVYSNFSSPLMWDILVLGTYLVLSVIYLWAYLRAEAGRMSHTAIRAISVVALIVAILVVPKLRTTPGVVVASVLAILGVFCKRLQILVGGFQIPNLDMPGVTTQYAITNWQAGFTGAYQGMVYAPQPIEFGVTLGVLAMCVLFLLLGLKYLPLKPSENVD